MLRWSLAFATVVSAAALDAQPAPRLDRITASTNASFEATVRGAAGVVAPSNLVAVMNLDTGHYSIVRADAEGGFETQLFAAGGSSILIKADPQGNLINEFEGKSILGESGQMLGLAGTIVQVPDAGAANGRTTMSGLASYGTLPVWVAEGRTDKATYGRGDTITAEGTITFLASAASAQSAEVDVILTLVGLTRADGGGTLDQAVYCSTVMTPTGLPIERHSFVQAGDLAKRTIALQIDGDHLRAAFQLTAPSIQLEIADGFYRPMLRFVTRGVAMTGARRIGHAERIDHASRRPYPAHGLLPPIRIGNPAPPRLHWTLLADTLSQGARGVTALQDRGRYSVSSRIALSSDRFVIPRIDPRAGAPIRYNLEPAALTIALGNSGVPPSRPLIPFRFPSGNLTVSVRSPGGTNTVLGPAPFRQPRLMGLRVRNRGLDANYFTDPYQLTTLDPRFEFEFLEEGTHEVAVSGTIEDIWGNVWSGGGTYVVDVARPLEIDSAVLPGTPLETGNAINPSVQLLPAVPADIEVRYRFAAGSRRDLVTEQTFRVKANAHGYARFSAIPVTQPGEYRIDVFATFRDGQRRSWAGTRTWGGVVAGPDPPVHLHGARGIDNQPDSRLAWFSRAQIGRPVVNDPQGHVHFAYHSGDVMWMSDDDSTTSVLRLDDRNRLLTTHLRPACFPGNDVDIAAGESGFCSVGPNGIDPYLAATDNELSAYAYRFVERPRVRIREMISEAPVAGVYWRFGDLYALQSGTGDDGDRPNDFKFQFGGLALYGRALSAPIHSIYASLFVLVATADPAGTRVFPPFEGNGGGPSGGPLFTLKNRDIEMFFHPTAVRPGTILEVGDTASFTGQIGPTLPSKVEIAVTSPSGEVRTIGGQANAVGYFYQPSSDFVVSERGVWRVRVRVWHEGRTSAGQVTPPFPSGDVLGSRDGEFSFYVADRGARLGLAPMPQFATKPGPLTFSIVPPPGLNDIEIHFTTTMPGFILEEGKLSGLTYVYDPAQISGDFPNLDYDRATGRPAVETITISFVLTARDANGAGRVLGRQVILEGDEILMPLPHAKRRSVR